MAGLLASLVRLNSHVSLLLQPPFQRPPQVAQPELGTAAGAVAAASVPADQAVTAPVPPSEPVWRLSSVRGEPQFGAASTQPVGPSPELSPEQIVEAQLAALQ